MVKLVLGLALLGHAANLLIFTVGRPHPRRDADHAAGRGGAWRRPSPTRCPRRSCSPPSSSASASRPSPSSCSKRAHQEVGTDDLDALRSTDSPHERPRRPADARAPGHRDRVSPRPARRGLQRRPERDRGRAPPGGGGGAAAARVAPRASRSCRSAIWPAPFGITLVADLLAAIMVLLTGVTGLAVAVYSLGSIDEAARGARLPPALPRAAHGRLRGLPDRRPLQPLRLLRGHADGLFRAARPRGRARPARGRASST